MDVRYKKSLPLRDTVQSAHQQAGARVNIGDNPLRAYRPTVEATARPPENAAECGRLTHQWRTISTDRARWGLGRALYMSLMRICARVLGLKVAVVHSRPLYGDPSGGEVASGYEVRELAEADYARIPLDERFDTPASFIASTRAAGGFCTGAFKDDELVATVWRSFGDAPADNGFRLKFAPHLRYGFKALTLPEHRGLHLQTPMSLQSDQACIERGCSLGASYIETHNFPSRTGDLRRGAQVVGYFVWMSKGPLRWCWSSPGARRFGIKLYDP